MKKSDVSNDPCQATYIYIIYGLYLWPDWLSYVLPVLVLGPVPLLLLVEDNYNRLSVDQLNSIGPAGPPAEC